MEERCQKVFRSTEVEYEEMFEGASNKKEGEQNTSPLNMNPINL